MKEVFTSGENILVSLNFNQEKTAQPEKPQKRQENRHEIIKDIVDITTRKKIAQSNSKPVAIIDLARSPFKVSCIKLLPCFYVITQTFNLSGTHTITQKYNRFIGQ